MLPAHVSSSRRGCPGSPARSRGQLGSRSGWGHGTGHPPPGSVGQRRQHPGVPVLPMPRGRGGRQDTPAVPRESLAHAAPWMLLARLWWDAHGLASAGPPALPRATHLPPAIGQTSRPAAEAGAQPRCRVSCSPGMLWAEPPRSGVTTNRPKPFSRNSRAKRHPGPGWGVGGQPGMGGTLVAEPPGGSGGSRAGPVAPDTAAGAAVSDGPVSSGEQSPIPPSGPIPGARVRARPGRSRGGQARTWHWGQSSPVCGQGREQATAGGHRPGQAACNPDRQHLTLPCAPSRGAFAAPRGGRPLPTASPGVLEWVMLQGTRTDTSVSPGCWHLTLPWPGR